MMPEETMVEETKVEEPAEGYVSGQVYEVSVNDLKPNPYQPRKYFDKKKQDVLADSVEENGFIQPITFGKDGGDLILVAGARRLEVAKKAGKEKIVAMFTEKDFEEIALFENLHREDLNPIELAEALQRYMDSRELNQVQLSIIIGKSESTVSEILSLNKLPMAVRDECRNDPSVPLRDLKKMVSKGKEEKMVKIYNEYKEIRQYGRKTEGERQSWDKRFYSKCDGFQGIINEAEDIESLDRDAIKAIEVKIEKLKEGFDWLLRKVKSLAKADGDEQPPEQTDAAA